MAGRGHPNTARGRRGRALRQLISARLGGRVRDFLVLVRGGGFVLRGRTGSFHLKQMVQATVIAATAFQLSANEIAVD